MVLALLLLGGAIASLYITYTIREESIRITSLLLAFILLIVSLVILPWLLKLLIAVFLLLIPSCDWHQLRHSMACPRLCLQRKQCLKHHS
jgi:hypothetical protein